MPTEQINIVINEKGGRVVKRNIDSIGKSVDKTEKSVLSLNRVLGSLATTLGLRELIKISDTYTLINSRLKLVTDNTQQLIQAERQLFNIAQRNRAGFSQTVELYQRFSRTAKELGLSQNTLLRVTEAVNQAILISGASSQAANAALIQLGQGIAGAELRGQELNSVLEQTPRLAQAIATGLGVSVGKLRKIAAEGALTSKAVIGAILSQEKKLTEEFGRVNKTIGQSFTQLQNALIRFLGRSDNVATATLNIGKALDFLTGNLGAATNALIAFVGGLAIRQVILYTVSIGGLTGAFVALNTAIAANPLGLVLTGLTIAIAGLTLFADKIKLSKEGLTTIGDLGSVVGSRIADGFNTAKGAITPFFEDMFHLADGTFKDIDFSLKNLLLGFGTFGDALMGAMFVLGDFVLNLFDNLGPLIGESLKATFNAVVLSITAVINGLNSAVNVVIGGVNKLLKGFNNKLTGIDRIASKFASFIGLDIGAPLKIPGLELIEIPKLDPSDILTDADFSFLGIDSGKAFKAGFKTGAFSDPIKQAMSDSEKNALKRDAKETGEETGKALGDGVGVGLVSKGANVFADKVGDIFSRSITEGVVGGFEGALTYIEGEFMQSFTDNLSVAASTFVSAFQGAQGEEGSTLGGSLKTGLGAVLSTGNIYVAAVAAAASFTIGEHQKNKARIKRANEQTDSIIESMNSVERSIGYMDQVFSSFSDSILSARENMIALSQSFIDFANPDNAGAFDLDALKSAELAIQELEERQRVNARRALGGEAFYDSTGYTVSKKENARNAKLQAEINLIEKSMEHFVAVIDGVQESIANSASELLRNAGQAFMTNAAIQQDNFNTTAKGLLLGLSQTFEDEGALGPGATAQLDKFNGASTVALELLRFLGPQTEEIAQTWGVINDLSETAALNESKRGIQMSSIFTDAAGFSQETQQSLTSLESTLAGFNSQIDTWEAKIVDLGGAENSLSAIRDEGTASILAQHDAKRLSIFTDAAGFLQEIQQSLTPLESTLAGFNSQIDTWEAKIVDLGGVENSLSAIRDEGTASILAQHDANGELKKSFDELYDSAIQLQKTTFSDIFSDIDFIESGLTRPDFLEKQINDIFSKEAALTEEEFSKGLGFITEWYNEVIDIEKNIAQEWINVADKVESIAGTLDQTIRDVRFGQFNLQVPGVKLEQSLPEYQQLLQAAKTGNEDSINKFIGFTDTFLGLNQESNKSSKAGLDIFNQVVSDLESLEDIVASDEFQQRIFDEARETNSLLDTSNDILKGNIVGIKNTIAQLEQTSVEVLNTVRVHIESSDVSLLPGGGSNPQPGTGDNLVFDKDIYLDNKQSVLLSNHGIFKSITELTENIKSVFPDSATPFQEHFQQFGRAEGVSPYAYATGGIALTPQLATVAEREPELIIPVREFLQSNRGQDGRPVTVIVEIGNKEFYSEMAEISDTVRVKANRRGKAVDTVRVI